MDILVIGATGGSGRAVCDALLARGHKVTAMARHASALPAHALLTRVDGDATDRATVERVIPGHDAIVITLGIAESPLRVRLRGAKGTPDDVRSRATELIVAAARAAGVTRLVVQSSYGVGETRSRLRFVDRVVFALLIGPQMRDTELQESVLRGSGLDWTIVQPVYLNDRESLDYFSSSDGSTRGRSITRRAVARVHADLVESPSRIRQTVSVSG